MHKMASPLHACSMDLLTIVFEDFIEQLLAHCGRWPELKFLLVVDNVSFHHSEHGAQLRSKAGVKLVYLLPYPPDLNPIEEFFVVLKAFVRNLSPLLSTTGLPHWMFETLRHIRPLVNTGDGGAERVNVMD